MPKRKIIRVIKDTYEAALEAACRQVIRKGLALAVFELRWGRGDAQLLRLSAEDAHAYLGR